MQKLSLPNILGLALLLCGILALGTSIIFVSSITAFIGLGLTFWGTLLLFLKQERCVKSKLLDSTVTSSLENLSRIITELNYKGKAIYLPPKYLKDFKSGIIYISKKEGDEKIPSPEEIHEEEIFSKNPQGICITPPGLNLTNLYEKETGTDFVRADLKSLQNTLPKLFIETLEIAQDLEMSTEGNLIQIELTDSVYKGSCNEARKLSGICNFVGCPLCSSIACALSRTTGKPIIIEKTECSENGKTIRLQYRILEE
jgi:hypothetical protein